MNRMFDFAVVIFVLTLSTAHAESINFQLPTVDGLAKITGQIDVPDCGPAPYPAILMVGGTGLFYRNGFFGRSRTDRDLLFQDLSFRLNNQCIATVRFDYRGVSCDLKSQSDVQNCLDQETRSHVTDLTILDDIQIVYDYASSLKKIDAKNIVLLGHSEGSLNISRLVQRGSVQPKAIIFFGGLTESAVGILHWQIAGRPAEYLMAMDNNHNQQVTNEEIKASYATSPIRNIYPIDSLLSATGFLSYDEISQGFEKVYQNLRTVSLQHADTDTYSLNGFKFTSYRWWKRWFLDDTSVLENLKNFDGPIDYHNGDIDSQTPGRRELALLQASPILMKSKPNFFLYPGKGHGLSSDPLYGPIDEDIANGLVKRINLFVK